MSQRVDDLEIKVAFLENHLADLDEVLRSTIARLERAETEVKQLRVQYDDAVRKGTLADEEPPHHGKL